MSELTIFIVDGYVWLGDESHPGLGGHLYAALDRKIQVVGVAKTHFVGAAPVNVQAMHGAHRLLTLLKRVDALCRART